MDQSDLLRIIIVVNFFPRQAAAAARERSRTRVESGFLSPAPRPCRARGPVTRLTAERNQDTAQKAQGKSRILSADENNAPPQIHSPCEGSATRHPKFTLRAKGQPPAFSLNHPVSVQLRAIGSRRASIKLSRCGLLNVSILRLAYIRRSSPLDLEFPNVEPFEEISCAGTIASACKVQVPTAGTDSRGDVKEAIRKLGVSSF